MTAKAKRVFDTLQDAVSTQTRPLAPDDYRAVLEELAADIDSRLACLAEEQAKE